MNDVDFNSMAGETLISKQTILDFEIQFDAPKVDYDADFAKMF